jgi:hypothetical protein
VEKTTKPEIEKNVELRIRKIDENSNLPPSGNVLTKLQRNLILGLKMTEPRRYVGSRKNTDVAKIVKNPVLIGNTSELKAR